MKRFFKVVVVRWLSRTPLGLAVLGAGWLLGRRRRRRRAAAAEGVPAGRGPGRSARRGRRPVAR
ncbi:DUF6203 family protein [Planomonospora corallina]|uniref:DUF6203 family protein n=1 Tax=Planomonospora corallina TaxID=1806052 RepID=A0ABV8IDU8_9ACTN